ncbi:PspA/IM30 family protein [Halodesulfovibrio sp. MK-HDV]|jgi:phage shock protein A|uniref:PspA/IM30 family protein n=1 Tax=Halodesulfovibrio sp. MK-HDV TaxID=2599925 RepID=UPI00136A3F18|nr:PspA/IM30 family protein [Halodesulfovibrio sp. MK-HDV]KAF1074111.1 Phage shock protein A [Halodesulfovibrio sp. MK-HDV]
MSIFKRMFKFTQSEAHAAMDKIEDPIKMTEQGIRDLQQDMKSAMTGLAEVKGMSINTRKQSEFAQKRAQEYEKKAMLLLQKMQNGELDPAEAERLATSALNEKETQAAEYVRLAGEADHHEKLAAQLQANVNKIKSTITSYQNDLTTLKARSKTAAATKRINEQVAQIDSSGTVAMLEKMKAKVEADEALATAYGEVASMETSVDDELDKALQGPSAGQSEQLAALKAKMGIAG